MRWILLLGMIVSFNANAWVGYGRISDEGAQRGDGSWRQYGHPSIFFKRNDKSMGYQIEFGGMTKWKWLGWTVGYQDTGNKTLYGRWVSDFNYFDGKFGKDVLHVSKLLETHSRGFVFTLDPQYTTKKGRFTVYGKFGVKAWRSKTKGCGGNPTDPVVLSSCPNGFEFKIEESGMAFYRAFGGQVNLKRSALYFEHGISKRDYDSTSFIRNSRPYMFGYRWGF